MNGIHDMGGMDGFGPIHPSDDNKPFQFPWEGRAFAHLLASGALGKWNNDAVRSHFENFAPTDYLKMSYFERWNVGLTKLLVEAGIITEVELTVGQADLSAGKATPPLRAQDVPAMLRAGEPFGRTPPYPPVFSPGTSVLTKNEHTTTHTRLPRYARGRRGIIARWHGGFVFPDKNALLLGECPQHLYSVRFEGEELWGGRGAVNTAVYIDIWERHLERQ